MMECRPSILIDMRKSRIRIHKQTLHAIGDPEFVTLIINPDEHTLGIKSSIVDDKLAHRVRKNTIKKEFELYSKSLITALHKLCPDWNTIGCYKIKGEIITEENMVVFYMRSFEKYGN